MYPKTSGGEWLRKISKVHLWTKQTQQKSCSYSVQTYAILNNFLIIISFIHLFLCLNVFVRICTHMYIVCPVKKTVRSLELELQMTVTYTK